MPSICSTSESSSPVERAERQSSKNQSGTSSFNEAAQLEDTYQSLFECQCWFSCNSHSRVDRLYSRRASLALPDLRNAKTGLLRSWPLEYSENSRLRMKSLGSS